MCILKQVEGIRLADKVSNEEVRKKLKRNMKRKMEIRLDNEKNVE